MKKLGIVLLAAVLLLCGCNETTTTSSDGSATVSQTAADTSSKKANSSKNTSSWTLDVAAFIREIDGENYFDVSAAAAASPRRPDDREFFPELDGFVGYYIEKGVYIVDADTMWRVLKCPFKGDGAIKWNDFSADNYMKNPDQYDGVLPISKMNDPLYVQMCLPNEAASDMGTAGRTDVKQNGRINAQNLFELTDRYVNALSIGAIYTNPEREIPDDAQITLCFGKIRLAARTKDSDGWFLADEADPLPKNIYPLPWQLENDPNPVKSYAIDPAHIKQVDGHYEIQLTGADLKGKNFKDDRVTGSILHFWGKFFEFEKGSDVLGIAASYTVWVKEPEWSGMLTAAIGTDIRGSDGYCQQAFTGINYEVTDQPRVVYGHNVGPKRYDEVMDSQKVCELFGIK